MIEMALKVTFEEILGKKGWIIRSKRSSLFFHFFFKKYIYIYIGLWNGLKIPEGRIARLSNDRKEFLMPLVRNMIVKMTLIFIVYVLMGKENIFLQTRGQENVSEKIVCIIATKIFRLNFLRLIFHHI